MFQISGDNVHYLYHLKPPPVAAYCFNKHIIADSIFIMLRRLLLWVIVMVYTQEDIE